MISLQNRIKTLMLLLALSATAATASSCGGSRAKANANQEPTPEAPAAVEVSTVPAVSRNLPRFVEATGSLAADEQTDVAPSVGGKVVYALGSN